MSGYAARHGRTHHYSPRHSKPSHTGQIAASAGVSGGTLALVATSLLAGGNSPAQAATMPVAHTPASHAGTAVATRKVATEFYTVRSGDTLSSIAQRMYGHSSRWPALWYVNRHKVHNPNEIRVGQRLELSSWHPRKAWLMEKAKNHIPAAHDVLVSYHTPSSTQHAHHYACGDGDGDGYDMPCSQLYGGGGSTGAAAPVSQPATTSYSAGAPGSFQACVISAESGGNPRAVNPSSGAGGLYQFLPSTWQALGYSGAPQDASIATQNAAFAKQYAISGGSAWSAYDGC